MRWFPLCCVTFLFMAVNNINASDNAGELPSLVKELCKYLIHLKRTNFCEKTKNISEAFPGNGPINNDVCNSLNSSEPLELSPEKNNSLENDDGTSADSKIEFKIIKESSEVQKNISENDSQKLRLVISIKNDNISKNPDSCNEKEGENCNLLDSKIEKHNNIGCWGSQPKKCQLDVEGCRVCPKHEIDQNMRNTIDCDGCKDSNINILCKELGNIDCSNEALNTNISESTENCSSKCHFSSSPECSQANKLNESHNETYICGRCPLHLCLEYFIPYFKRCKLKVCKKQENLTDEAQTSSNRELNNIIHKDCPLSCQKHCENEKCVKEPSENCTKNEDTASSITNLCGESNSIHTTQCCNKNDDNMFDKQCSEFELGICNISNNVSCNVSHVCNRNLSNSDLTCNRIKECFQNTCSKTEWECSDYENISRDCDIPENKNLQNICCKCPTCSSTSNIRYSDLNNNCNFSKIVSLNISNSNYLEPATCETERQCGKDDEKPHSEPRSFNISTDDADNHNGMLCSKPNISNQDCNSNHDCLTRNDSTKPEAFPLKCKANIPDPTIRTEEHPCCKYIEIVLSKPLKCKSDTVCEKSDTKSTISHESCEDSCLNELLFNKNEEKEPSLLKITTNDFEVYNACYKGLTDQNILEISSALNNIIEDSDKYKCKKSLCRPFSFKNKKSLINECQEQCKKNNFNCTLVDQECSNLSDHDIKTRHLVNLIKIISALNNVFTKEYTKQNDSISDLAPEKCNDSISNGDDPCDKYISLKSEKCANTKGELTCQSKISQHTICKQQEICHKTDENVNQNSINESDITTNISKDCKQMSDLANFKCDCVEEPEIKTISCSRNKSELISFQHKKQNDSISDLTPEKCNVSISNGDDLCNKYIRLKSEKCANTKSELTCQSKISQHTVCKLQEMCIKTEVNVNQNSINESDISKDCKQMSDITNFKCVEEPEIKTISCSRNMPELISFQHKNDSTSEKDCDNLCGDIFTKSSIKDEPNCNSQTNFCESKCSDELSKVKNCADDISEACFFKNHTEQCSKDFGDLDSDGSFRSVYKPIDSLKNIKEFDSKHIPICCSSCVGCLKKSPQHWLTRTRYRHRRPWQSKLVKRNQRAKNLIKFKRRRQCPRTSRKIYDYHS